MRNKRLYLTMVLTVLLSVTAACGSDRQANIEAEGEREASSEKEGQKETGDERENLSQGLGETTGQMVEVQKESLVEDAYTFILEGCTPEFSSGYKIEKDFLAWIRENYGEEVLFALEKAVESNEQDSEWWYQETGSSIHVLWDTCYRDTGSQEERLERVYWKECASEDEIVLDFIGDVNFDENWSTTRHLDQQVDGIFDCLSPALMEELNQADILVVNNEFTYSTRGTPIPGKAYTFRADPDRVYLFELMGADIASLANNHAYDYGPEALVDSLVTLEEAGIPHVGAGRNLEEAMKPCYFIANGRKIAIVSATQIERSTNYTKEATEDAPGVLKTLDPKKFVTVIEEAEENADYVIVYVHWGTEHNPYFGHDQMALADAYIGAGADAIIGTHTHCLQGYEFREGVPVLYSLGNFWFNSNKLDTGVGQLIIHKDGTMDMRFLPCVQKKNETYLAEDEQEKQRILAYMESISSGVSIDEAGYVTPKE